MNHEPNMLELLDYINPLYYAFDSPLDFFFTDEIPRAKSFHELFVVCHISRPPEPTTRGALRSSGPTWNAVVIVRIKERSEDGEHRVKSVANYALCCFSFHFVFRVIIWANEL